MGILQYDRKRFFDGVGVDVEKKNNISLNEVIEQAGLNYVVEKVKNYDPEGDELDSWSTRYFDKEGVKHNLGTGLKENYTVLQNYEAFDFLQDIMQDLDVECAGSTNGGKKTFICAKTEPVKVLGDDIDPYMVFTNSFDGTTGVQVLMTPIRVFCSNCMAIASRKASNRINIKHSKNILDKLYIAKDILLKNTEYLKQYKHLMEEAVQIRFNRRDFVDKLVPFVLYQMGLLDSKYEPIEKKRNSNVVDVYKEHLLEAWSANDTANCTNTVANAILAMTDFESHIKPMKNANNPETTFKRVVQGMVLSGVALEKISEITGKKVVF